MIDVFNTNEQSLIGAIKYAIEGKNMQIQYYDLGYKIDLYFPDYKIAIEDHEFNYIDRDPEYEATIRIEIEEGVDSTFIRFNTTDAPNFKTNKALNGVYRQLSNQLKSKLKNQPKNLRLTIFQENS